MRLRDLMTARRGLIAAVLALVGLGVIGAGAAWRAAVQPQASAAAEDPCDCKAGIRAKKLRSRRDQASADLP